MYRSGRNEADSKSVDGSNRPGVRIPPSPPLASSGSPLLAFSLCGLYLLRLPAEHSAHGICGFLLCSEVQVGVNICCCCECAVSQPDLNLLHRDSAAEKQAGAGVPLRYNNDKQKKPLFSRGLSVCRLLFNSFSKLKIDENYKEKRRLFY